MLDLLFVSRSRRLRDIGDWILRRRRVPATVSLLERKIVARGRPADAVEIETEESEIRLLLARSSMA
ncbi:hypothetical protein B296_00009243 [Ensete ventricosum]|uniref:Uncharacterized protein n=1 Tax=Ensete ventricosum TaxID=4639 RepID=A0A427AX80_ENSVE|nr:hypothetical protein B296_00009243 [Ensete ventricosum]